MFYDCRRKSERVTDIERRTLAEKIRQENIKKEQELLESMKSKHKKAAEKSAEQGNQVVSSSEPETSSQRPKRSKHISPSKSTGNKPNKHAKSVKPLASSEKPKDSKPVTKHGKKTRTASPAANSSSKEVSWQHLLVRTYI